MEKQSESAFGLSTSKSSDSALFGFSNAFAKSPRDRHGEDYARVNVRMFHLPSFEVHIARGSGTLSDLMLVTQDGPLKIK